MHELYEQCVSRMKDIASLGGTMGILGWDQETMMPERAAKMRADQLAALAVVIHEKQTARDIGDMLEKLSSATNLNELQKANVREWHRDYQKSVKIPQNLARDLAKTTSLAQRAWVDAKKNSDFASFAPWMEKIVDLKRQQADVLGYQEYRYDALLDNYEPRMTVRALDPIANEVREQLVPVVEAIRVSGKTLDTTILTKNFAEPQQETLCREVITAIGIDTNASRFDRSAHPFCGGVAPTDVRMTTRYSETWLPMALYGSIHEAGHGLYEQGLKEEHAGTPLADAISLGIHESQSRLWENIIGRSKSFVKFLLPKLKKYFPTQCEKASEEEIYRALNSVKPSFIRVEADEVTYNLHVLLRYELEKMLIAGDIQVKNLPSEWNDRMKTYLGVVPKNDAEGVLQDVHWSAGLYGYFPTYMLGNLYASQWWEIMNTAIPKIDEKIAAGNFSPILGWLRENIHQHGRLYTADELVKRITGKTLSAIPFANYLNQKYRTLYGY